MESEEGCGVALRPEEQRLGLLPSPMALMLRVPVFDGAVGLFVARRGGSGELGPLGRVSGCLLPSLAPAIVVIAHFCAVAVIALFLMLTKIRKIKINNNNKEEGLGTAPTSTGLTLPDTLSDILLVNVNVDSFLYRQQKAL